MLMVESYCHSVEGQWSEERAHGYLISLHFFQWISDDRVRSAKYVRRTTGRRGNICK